MTRPAMQSRTRKRYLRNYVIKPNGCWIWNGASKGGYGIVQPWAGTRHAHRFMYQELVGPIPENHEVYRLCDTQLCVNPEHHRAAPKGAAVRRNHNTKLGLDEVRDIRRFFAEGATESQLSRWFKVSRITIHRVVNRESWKDIE